MASVTTVAAFLQVEIKGQSYGLEIIPTLAPGCRVVRLTKADGTVYDVTEGPDRTSCDCPDWTRRHAELPYSEGCKHIRAMVASGIVENVRPAATWEPEPEISETTGLAVMPGEYDSVPTFAMDELTTDNVPTLAVDVPTLALESAPAITLPSEASKPAPVVPQVAPAVPVRKPVRNLADAYRPRTLADVVGQDEIVFQLREFADAPSETAFLFDGDTGVGKTSAALALAADLGCDVEKEELGGVYTIAAGNQLAEDVRDTLRSLSLRPMYGSGWKVLIVNECDRMSEAVAYLWLDALENLPPRAVVVFSTNRVDKLPRRFITRCERHTFASSVDRLALATQARVNEVWYAETGRVDAPSVADLDAIDPATGQLSIRAALQMLTGHVRKAVAEASKPQTPASEPEAARGPQAAPAGAKVESPKPAPARPKAKVAGGSREARKPGKWDHVDFAALATDYRSGIGLSDLSVKSGVPVETIHGRLKKLGVTFGRKTTNKVTS